MKPIEELTFTDDYMFGYVMRNEEICKGLLERLLGIKIQRLEFPTLQKTIAPHYESKGVRLDVYVQDSTRVFDIEIQNSLDEDLPTRLSLMPQPFIKKRMWKESPFWSILKTRNPHLTLPKRFTRLWNGQRKTKHSEVSIWHGA